MASDKVVPKSYRLMSAVPTVQTAKDLVDDIVRSNEFYPNTARNAVYRKHYMTMAVADCKRLLQDLQTLKDIGLPINLNRFEALVGSVEREITLLKGARKAVKVVGSRPLSDRIDEARMELNNLEELAREK